MYISGKKKLHTELEHNFSIIMGHCFLSLWTFLIFLVTFKRVSQDMVNIMITLTFLFASDNQLHTLQSIILHFWCLTWWHIPQGFLRHEVKYFLHLLTWSIYSHSLFCVFCFFLGKMEVWNLCIPNLHVLIYSSASSATSLNQEEKVKILKHAHTHVCMYTNTHARFAQATFLHLILEGFLIWFCFFLSFQAEWQWTCILVVLN